MSEAMDKALANDLRAAGIGYVVNQNGQLCVNYASVEHAAKIMHNIYVREIPEGYSDALSDPIRAIVTASLRDKGISFQEKNFLGATYLIWQPEDDATVRELIEESIRRYLENRD